MENRIVGDLLPVPQSQLSSIGLPSSVMKLFQQGRIPEPGFLAAPKLGVTTVAKNLRLRYCARLEYPAL